VRRPAGPWTPAVHALLAYLHDVGFRGAPRPLGNRRRTGREVLTFMPGTVAWPGHFHLLDADGQLRRVGRLIREFHDAVAGFDPPPGARWQALMPADGDEIIAHNDLAPWNLVIGGSQWAFIDWDTAAPGNPAVGPRLRHARVRAAERRPGPPARRRRRRLRLIADAYDLSEQQRAEVIPLLARRTRVMHDFLARQAARGAQPWARLWREGHGDAWLADTRFIARHEHRWHQALLG